MRYELASSSWDAREIDAIRSVIESDMFSMGERVRTFEREFAAFTGNRYCVMVNSGSSANLLAVAAMFYRSEGRLERGDEVIVPAVSWATTYSPLHQYGLRLRFADIDAHTLNYDIDALSRAIGSEQLKKLPGFLEHRRRNAEYFQKIFADDERFIVQREIGSSSWFGFSLVIRPDAGLDRARVVERLAQAGIDTRPIVAGNFARKEVVRYFDHEISGELTNADLIDTNGFFVGNHHFDISDRIDYLKETLGALPKK